jgi:hypothetical protein
MLDLRHVRFSLPKVNRMRGELFNANEVVSAISDFRRSYIAHDLAALQAIWKP